MGRDRPIEPPANWEIMIRRALRLVLALMLCGAAVAALGRGGAAGVLSRADQLTAQHAVAAAERGRWAEAERTAKRATHPLVLKLVRWLRYQEGGGADFADIARFLDDNAGWPERGRIRVTAETSLPSADPVAVLIWLDQYPPLTAKGMTAHADALFALGRVAEALAAVRRAWREADFTTGEERDFYRRYRRVLTPADHWARVDRLLWEQKTDVARRAISHLDEGRRRLAEARLALVKAEGGVDRAIDRVPAALADDPGLLYERVRWRRIKEQHDEVRAILLIQQGPLVHPEKWWVERRYAVREALAEGAVSDAYRLASDHGQTDPANIADAEWLSGWIALRFLDDARTACRHFHLQHAAVKTPVSVSRASYWLGACSRALGDEDGAAHWFSEAAARPTTFYGQLAHLELTGPSGFALPVDGRPSAKARAAFEKSEPVQIIRILAAIGERARVRPFILNLVEAAVSNDEHTLIAALAEELESPELAVAVAKQSARDHVWVIAPSYPQIKLPRDLEIEPALVLSVARQESEFNAAAVSPAGARGLMQLMPATAERVAKWLRVPYSLGKLTRDPQYNVRLGSRFLRDLIEENGGSYVLAIAAYNAGGSRVKEWIANWGDPRNGDIDPIDWIELIPFSETRNYVQRVLESVQVYRARLSNGETRLGLAEDLARGRKG
ncbi:MAG: lytic transglycosylase domain-containing protein [Alphaproteobacteria bacterium]|nr:lytic transglycosylase domain-containing protein [Alphaproteobacteria bacterium]